MYTVGRIFKSAPSSQVILLSVAAAGLIIVVCRNVLFPTRQETYISLTAETTGEICLCDVVVDGENIPVAETYVAENSGWLYQEQWDNFMIWPEEDGTENRLTLRFVADEVHLGFPYTPYAGSVTIVSSAGRDGGTWDLRCPEWKEGEAVQNADFSFDCHYVYSPLELLLYGAGILPFIGFACLPLFYAAELAWKKCLLRYQIIKRMSIVSWLYRGLVLVFSCVIVLGGKLNVYEKPYFQPVGYKDFIRIVLCCMVIFIVGIIFRKCNRQYLFEIQRVSVSRWWWFRGSLLLILLWSPYLLSYYPGILTPDSFTSLIQAKDISLLYNHIPVAYTLMVTFFARIGWAIGDANFGVFLFSAAQLSIMAVILSYLAYWIRRNLNSKLVSWAILCFYGFNLAIAMHSITMWKDVLFSAWIVLLGVFLGDTALKEGKNLKKKEGLRQLNILFVLVAFGRNNGIYVVVFCWLILLLFFKTVRKRVLAGGGAAILAALLIQGPGYKSLGIRQAGFAESVGIPLQQISYTVVQGGELNEEEREFLENIIPINVIKDNYSPTSADNIKFNAEFNTAFFEQNEAGFIKLYLKLLPTHIKSYIESYLLSTSGFWKIQETNWLVGEEVSENDMGIYNVDYLKKVFHLDMKKDMSDRITSLRLSPITNVGIMVWLVFFFAMIGLKRKQTWKLYLVLPLIGCWITIMIATPVSAQFRYVYYYHLMLPVVCALMFAEKTQMTETEACQDI